MVKNRIIVGASYGMKEWLLQRLTAVVMLLYTVMMLVFLLTMPGSYEEWRIFFQNGWVQVFSQITFAALLYHVWIGMRDVWMDYIKPDGVRLVAHSLTILWLLGSLVYSAKVIWGL